MKEAAYLRYVNEANGWLHEGRRSLIDRLLGFHLPLLDREREILELGAGVGQNIPTLARHGAVDALEIDPLGLAALRQRADLRTLLDQPIPCTLDRRYDLICAFDVIEHLEDDRGALRWIADHLHPGGLFLATVPAHPWFFTRHDVAVGHYRRYTAASFRSIVPDGLEWLSGSHFNTRLFPVAVAARALWVAKHRLLGTPPEDKQGVPGQGMAGRLLSSVFLDEVAGFTPQTRRRFGLSYYACLRKASAPGQGPDKAPNL